MTEPTVEELSAAEARSNAFLNGVKMADLPNHRDPMFQNFSIERRSSMPSDLRKKLGRLRFNNQTGDAEKRAANIERAALMLQGDDPNVDETAALVIPRRPAGRPRKMLQNGR